jgi:HlyD family secretion protein
VINSAAATRFIGGATMATAAGRGKRLSAGGRARMSGLPCIPRLRVETFAGSPVARGSTMRRLLVVVLLLALVAVGAWALLQAGGQPAGAPRLTVGRGTVVRKALATGQVEPEQESQVNSRLTGFVRTVHAVLGQKINAGDPLCEVWPTLTEEDRLRAERGLQQAIEGEEAAGEFRRGDHVLANITRWLQGEHNLDRMQKQAERGRRTAEETLKLLNDGKVDIDGRTIDFVVRAPVGGHVLQIVRLGDPVTPASNYGVGTVVAVLGDLDRPVFRGTVDEIDVGRLRVDMPARVTLGALPGTELRGQVREIGLRARRQDNAALFDVRIALAPQAGLQLRAGYSAVAEFELARADNALTLPERALQFHGDQPFVLVAGAGGQVQERPVKTGVSDGLTVEIVSGLVEGEQVVERPAGR